ncbi:MAG: hypothetical protein ACQKBY_08560, partial [Verrucomicrobiales bacterium]
MKTRPQSRNGFVLVLTITAIAGLMILMMGVLSMVRLERNTARAYSDGVQAELALEAGMEAARLRVLSLAQSDDYLLHTGEQEESATEKPVVFASVRSADDSAWRHIPLVSGVPEEVE